MAMYYTYTHKLDVLEQNKQNTDERAMEAIKEFGIETVRPLTEDETEKLNSGEISQEEAVNLILGLDTVETSNGGEDNTTSSEGTSTSNNNAEKNGTDGGNSSTNADNGNKNTGNNKNNGISSNKNTGNSNKNNGNAGTNTGNTNTNTNTNVNQEKNEEIARLIGEMYVLKAKFSSDLKEIEDWVNAKYREYTKEYGEGNIPYNVKAKVGKAAYNKALDLETTCDGKVEQILSQITVLLKETGQNTGVVNEIRAAYENEKMLAKSYYMEQAD